MVIANKDFIQACLDGQAKPSELNDYVEFWHDRYRGDKTLGEFLGMTSEEQAIWAKNDDSVINGIIQRRRDNAACPKEPKFKVEDMVWYIDNASLKPRHGMITVIIQDMDNRKPVSYAIDDDDGIHAVVRHEPFIFSKKKECDFFAKMYGDAIRDLLVAFFTRIGITEPVNMADAKAYMEDVTASLYGKLESFQDMEAARNFLKMELNSDSGVSEG